MARRENKDRGLFERPPGSGTWWIRYHDTLGKEHREKVGPKGLARQVYAKRKTDIREGRFFPKTLQRRRHIRLTELIDEYLLEAKANQRSFATSQSHARLWSEVFGDIAVDELTPADLEKWKRERLTTHAKATIVRELSWLRRLYNVAIRDEKVEKNPVLAVQMPKVSNGRIRFLTDPEEASLKTVMTVSDFELVELAINTGMRRSEQFNLRWEDVDFHNTVLSIPQSKNGHRRYVPINHRALAILRERRNRADSAWVFPAASGETPMNGHNFAQRVFNKACREAGIVGVSWHVLRHTTGSRLAMAGADIRSIQEILGHRCLSQTVRYSHLSPSHLKDVINRLLPTPSTAAPTQAETPDELTAKPGRAGRKPKSTKESPQ